MRSKERGDCSESPGMDLPDMRMCHHHHHPHHHQRPRAYPLNKRQALLESQPRHVVPLGFMHIQKSNSFLPALRPTKCGLGFRVQGSRRLESTLALPVVQMLSHLVVQP